jgi:Heterokaryon incompatibility protein (HET)
VVPITVNDSTFFVTPNLSAALKALRRSAKFGGKSRTLWIDAICINQGDVNERNHQVAQMQEIYAGAQEVVVWLGPADSTIELAGSFVHDLCKHLNDLGIFDLSHYTAADLDRALEKVTTQFHRQKWLAVVEILLKPWWGRVWVIQELASAPRAILQSGNLSLPWPEMALVIQVLNTWHPSLTQLELLGDLYETEVGEAIYRAASIANARTTFQRNVINSFESLIYLSQLSQCKDPRDKVYALLGLASSDVRKIIQPDYNRPIAWTFAIVIEAHVHCYADLNILGAIQVSRLFLKFITSPKQPLLESNGLIRSLLLTSR